MTHLSIPVIDIVDDTAVFDIASDGRSIVYSGGSPLKIYHRRFDRPDVVAIPGTEGGRSPVISPDGQSIVFHADTAIKRVPLAGGTPRAIHPQELIVFELGGGAWASDGTVYISAVGNDFGYSTLLAFPEQGGVPRVVIPMADEAGKFYERLYPQLLPGEEQLLYVRLDGDQLDGVEASNVMVLDLETGVETMILPQHGFARYLPSGHLLAVSGTDHLDLMPFDLDSKAITGPSVPIQKLIRTQGSRTGALFEVAPDGTVVFARASLEESGARLAWLGLDGQTTEVRVATRRYENVSLSPDSSKAVVTVGPSPYSLWVYDFEREVLSAVTSHASGIFSPIWMPTGNRIALKTGGVDGEPHGVSLLDLDSGEPATRLAETGTVWTVVWDVSPDGKTIAAFIWDPVSENDWDIVLIPTDGSTEPILFSSEDSNEAGPRFAPNGQWIAFTSDRSGIDEIYLRRYPEQGPLIQVSSQGATTPFWGLDGSSLYFVALGTFDLMKVDLTWQGELSISPVQKLFTIPPGYRQYGWQLWASGLSEERGLLVIHNEQQVIESLDVIFGWATELERMAPTRSK
jgi:Tol biopolymer transport system component